MGPTENRKVHVDYYGNDMLHNRHKQNAGASQQFCETSFTLHNSLACFHATKTSVTTPLGRVYASREVLLGLYYFVGAGRPGAGLTLGWGLGSWAAS
eukprot:scaffold653023_cov60-Prasinocladus_malaysianus.AAC.1